MSAAPSPLLFAITAIVLLAVIGVVIVVPRVRRMASRSQEGTGVATTGLSSGDPQRIGPYQLVGRLGGGGMGQVYLGRSPGGRDVAVKVVRPDLAGDPDFRRRFATEIVAARRVGGFHTAQLVDADPDGDPPWLATAYIPGPSLHEAVRDHGPLPPASVAALGAGLAEGLIAVHACQIVHRDLKPGNVILAHDGPRLIDFGIARALDATSHTRTSTVLGTAAFMSPEQVTGRPVGPASDVFSLGCVLAYAATGRSPFGEGPAHGVTHRIVYDSPDLSGLPAPLAGLVGACLAKDPAARPGLDHVLAVSSPHSPIDPGQAKGEWLPEALTEVIALRATRVLAPGPDKEDGRAASAQPGSVSATLVDDAPEPVSGRPLTGPAVPRPLPRGGGRMRTAWGAVLGVGVLTAGTLIVLNASPRAELTLDEQGDTVETVAFSPDGALLATGADDHLRLWDARTGEHVRTMNNPWLQSAAFSPDGDLIAAGCQRDVCLYDVKSGDLTDALTGHKGAVRDVAFSPDGTLLATASQDTTVRLWNVAGGEHLRTFSGHRSSVNSVAFAPDGKTLVTAGGTVRRWDVQTGEQIAELAEHKNTTLYAVAFAPDGTTFASAEVSGDVFVWDAATNKRRFTLQGHKGTVNDMAYSADGSVLATVANDDFIRFWNPATGDSLGDIEASDLPTHAVAFSPDGTMIATGGQDDTARLWKLDEVLAGTD